MMIVDCGKHDGRKSSLQSEPQRIKGDRISMLSFHKCGDWILPGVDPVIWDKLRREAFEENGEKT